MEKFKIGDKVFCKPGYQDCQGYKYGGAGYIENKELTISSFTDDGNIVWVKEVGNGIYLAALELSNNYEIY
jgi:hypothetical protein